MEVERRKLLESPSMPSLFRVGEFQSHLNRFARERVNTHFSFLIILTRSSLTFVIKHNFTFVVELGMCRGNDTSCGVEALASSAQTYERPRPASASVKMTRGWTGGAIWRGGIKPRNYDDDAFLTLMSSLSRRANGNKKTYSLYI